MRTTISNSKLKSAAGLLAYLLVLSKTAPLHSAVAFYSHTTSRTSPLTLRQSRRQERHHRGRVFSVQTDMTDDTVKILGVCGGIGSGKSTACKLMVDVLGCVDRIDADLLAHDVYEPGSQSLKDIVAEFGDDILTTDNAIDRKKLGSIVFGDSNAMLRLEQIVWPHVRTKIEDKIGTIKEQHQKENESRTNNIIIVEAALLRETNWHDLLDGLWVIQSSPHVAVQRLKDNRGLTEEEALTRINAQQKRRGIGKPDETATFTRDIENGVITAVITNDGTLADLQTVLDEHLKNPSSFK
eukprot:scaffold3275_cov70-Cyclotella_meneghiniana.AAC.4